MRRALLYSASFFLFVSCSPLPASPITQSLYIFRFDPPALLEFSADLTDINNEIPLYIPPECSLWSLHPQTAGPHLAIELACAGGQVVVLLDVEMKELSQPIDDPGVDSHFLAWGGDELYLRVDSLGDPHIQRIRVESGKTENLSITPYTYDLAPSPNGEEFTFSYSTGLGSGSELWLADHQGKNGSPLFADPEHILAYTRWSPDGKQIAFLRNPDSQTPFNVGELWVMNADRSGMRYLADADAGHGYAPAWSPDGKRIAFVGRDNPDDPTADQSASGLVSNLYIVETESGEISSLTHIENALVEAPFWSADGRFVAFNAVANGTMNVWIADMAGGEIEPVLTEAACCPAWMQR